MRIDRAKVPSILSKKQEMNDSRKPPQQEKLWEEIERKKSDSIEEKIKPNRVKLEKMI